MALRTDLAAESLPVEGLPGVSRREYRREEVLVTAVMVETEEAARALGKARGRYITVETAPFGKLREEPDAEAEAVAAELKELLPGEGLILVAGLGNRDITPDALGPRCAGEILATRHFSRLLERSLGESFRPVAALAPGVLGQTGFETEEVLRALVEATAPAAVVTVDALASRSASRLGRTVQITDCGISPGSGVANARKEISRHTLGVPVVSLGVPTVADATCLAAELLAGEAGEELRELLEPGGEALMVTPREIDQLVRRAGHLLALSINRALQPRLSLEEIRGLLA